jgi:nicotinamidase-related amidase
MYKRLSRDKAAVLFVDHQTGLLSLVQDFTPTEFYNNVLALADIAEYFKLPTILTTSYEQGPNGPIMPELKQKFPQAPYIARPGQINAWDNEEFVAAVKKTGKTQLIIAGIVTDVCVAFPTLSALTEGFEVFVAVDASGTLNEVCRMSAWNRMSQAGAQLISWFALAAELRRDWREDMQGFLDLNVKHLLMYRNLLNSHNAKK